MGYLDTELDEETRIMLDSLSPSEFRELYHEGGSNLPRAVLDHYKETYLWWSDTIHDPRTSERVPYEPIPTPERLAKASEHGSFLVDDEPEPPGTRLIDWR